MSYEDVLEQVGTFGVYQKRICLFLFCIGFSGGLGSLTMIFTLYSPDHHCRVSGLNRSQEFHPSNNMNISAEDRCKELVLNSGNNSSTIRYVNFTNNCCSEGWSFDEPEVSTVITEYNLVCSDAWKKPLAISMFMLGAIVGIYIGGLLSDRFGRRPILLACVLLKFLLMFALGFPTTITSYIVLMAFAGVFLHANYCTTFVLGQELVGKEHRNKVSFSLYGGYCFIAATVPILGWIFNDWRWLMRCTGLIGLLYIPLYWLVPESPLWYLSSGQGEKATTVLATIAKVNGKPHPGQHVVAVFKSNEESKLVDGEAKMEMSARYQMLQIITVPTIRLRILVASFSWLVTNMVYYALALNISAFSGDRFINAAISGLLEYPGIIMGSLIIQWIGRPVSLSLLMGAGGMCLAAAPFAQTVSAGFTTALVIIGKTFIIGAFYINFSITGEMSPTLLRNASIGVTSAIGKIGSFLAPYLMFLGETNRYLPFLVMGGLSCISSLLTILFLPETMKKVLPDSPADAERLKPVIRNCCVKRKTELVATGNL